MQTAHMHTFSVLYKIVQLYSGSQEHGNAQGHAGFVFLLYMMVNRGGGFGRTLKFYDSFW